MNFHIITLFPEAFVSYLSESILARAQKEKKISVKFYNPRDFATPTKASRARAKLGIKDEKPYLRIDDKPYGGGPGVVMQALPVAKAINKAVSKTKTPRNTKIIFLSPGGVQFDTKYAKTISKKYKDVIIVSGRYEGIDARIKKMFSKIEDVSVGPFVLTGGELPAMIMVDCISRQVEGVLGNFDSLEEERVSAHDVYTRPEVLEYKGKKYKVPKVLLSGHQAKIDEWKRAK